MKTKKRIISKAKKLRVRSPKTSPFIFNRKYLFILLLVLLPIIIYAILQYRSYRIKAQTFSIDCTPGECVLGGGVGFRWISLGQIGGIINSITGGENCIPAPDASCGTYKIHIGNNSIECSPFHPQGIDVGLISGLKWPPEGVCIWGVNRRMTCNLATGYVEDLGQCDSSSTGGQNSGVQQPPGSNNQPSTGGTCIDCALCGPENAREVGTGAICLPEPNACGGAKLCWQRGSGIAAPPSTGDAPQTPGNSGVNCAGKNCNWQIFCVKGSDYPGKECIPNGEACEDKPDKDVCRDADCTGCQ